MRRPDKKALLREARKQTLRLRQLARQIKKEPDERLTRELIAECGRYVESLEAAKAFWLKILQDSLEAPSRGGKA